MTRSLEIVEPASLNSLWTTTVKRRRLRTLRRDINNPQAKDGGALIRPRSDASFLHQRIDCSQEIDKVNVATVSAKSIRGEIAAVRGGSRSARNPTCCGVPRLARSLRTVDLRPIA
jgi:hypothetical protein